MAALQRVPSCLQALSTYCRLLFCLQILENVVKNRWGTLDCTQRADIRDFVRDQIDKLSMDELLFRQEEVNVNQLNITLVQVGMPILRRQKLCPDVYTYSIDQCHHLLVCNPVTFVHARCSYEQASAALVLECSRTYPAVSAACCADREAGLAEQVSHLHHRHRPRLEDQRAAL